MEGRFRCTCTERDVPAIDDRSASGARVPSKVCALCGIDVSGHRRYRDSRGYICRRCYLNERDSARDDNEACEGCGRVVSEEDLSVYDGQRLCPRCIRERRETQDDRKRFRKVDFSHHERHHARDAMLIIVLVLVLVLLFALARVGRF
jgi:recombinational DNA repair protein (RecF pathway)